MQSYEAWMKFNAVAGSLGQDPARYAALQRAEARYWGLSYGGRSYAWTDEMYPGETGVPIPPEKKRPSRQYNLARRATDDTVDLLCGEGRFPALTVADNDAATEALKTLVAHTNLEMFVRELATRMVSVGSGAITMRPDAIPAQWATLDVWSARYCIPKFGDDDLAEAARLGVSPRGLLELRIQYAYPQARPGQREPDWYIFRRDYTSTSIIDYQPWRMPVGQVIEPPRFTVTNIVDHGLGRVPAVWVRSRYVEGEVDGPGLYESVDSLLEGIDMAVSLLDSSVKYSTAPLAVIEGMGASEAGTKNAISGGHGNTMFLPARSNVVPHAKFLEISGTAHQSAREHIAQLREMALEIMRVIVRRDSENGGALSGTAIQLLYRPMLSLVSGYRTMLEVVITELAEILIAAGQRYGSTLRTKAPLPAYVPGPVVVDWPPVFSLTAEEITQHAQAYASLVSAGLMSRETAIEQVAAILRIADVAGEKRRIKSDRDAVMQEARAAFDDAMNRNGDGNGNADGATDGAT